MRELRRRVRAEQSKLSFEPCLPRPAKQPPSGPGWLHEIKHDGYRVIARRNAAGLQLITRNGYDLSYRFKLAANAVAALRARSCVIDGEAIACDDSGLSVFELIRNWRNDHAMTLCAFDLLELNGEDLRRLPIEERKRRLAKLLRDAPEGIAYNEHYDGDGATIYRHACALGCEGINASSHGRNQKSLGLTLRTLTTLMHGVAPQCAVKEPVHC